MASLVFTIALASLVIWFPRRLKHMETSRIDRICERWGLPRRVLRKWADSRSVRERHALAILREYRSELTSLRQTKVWDTWKHDPTRLERELERLRFASERAAIARQFAAREL